MKPVLHHSQFQTGPHELVLLCLIKLKWEFVFTEEVMVKTSIVQIYSWSQSCYFYNTISDNLAIEKSYSQVMLFYYLMLSKQEWRAVSRDSNP